MHYAFRIQSWSLSGILLNMKIIVAINLALFSALIVAGSKLEATEGQNVTVSFDIKEVEKTTEVRITFKGVNEEQPSVIARLPWIFNDKPRPGVSLVVEEGRVNVTIHNVSISRDAGLYTAEALIDKRPTASATLVVHCKPQSSSSPAPPHTSTPKPPSSSELQWLYVLIPVVVVIIIIIIIIIRRRRRKWEPAADVEGAREAPCPQTCFQKRELENCCNACVSVDMNNCKEKAEALLPDTQVP